MIRISTLAAALLVWLALSPSQGSAQRVSGRVTDETAGRPLPEATVTLVDSAGRTAARAVTDGDGAWSLRAPLVDAYYRVRVDRVGYARIETEAFLSGPDAVVLKLATRREVVTWRA
jgi:hypothetical protein